MLVFPNAKINLGLHIISKRPDGYHNLESCFYPVPWTDVLEIVPSQKLSFTSTGIFIPGLPSDNLCLKAWHLLKQDFDLPAVQIHLHKSIPIGAGLGGGSSDGAFALKTIRSLFRLPLTDTQLIGYARKLGSDCAFFIQNKPQFCVGRGDEFEATPVDLSGRYVVLVYPGVHVSTAEAYAGIQPAQPGVRLHEVLQKPVAEWKQTLQNDFEANVFVKHPALARIKAQLYEAGALYACMSGSGSSVFGIFERELNLRNTFPEGYKMWQGSLPQTASLPGAANIGSALEKGT